MDLPVLCLSCRNDLLSWLKRENRITLLTNEILSVVIENLVLRFIDLKQNVSHSRLKFLPKSKWLLS